MTPLIPEVSEFDLWGHDDLAIPVQRPQPVQETSNVSQCKSNSSIPYVRD